MKKKGYDINTDWVITMPFRILEAFIFLFLARTVIIHPEVITKDLPVTFREYLIDFTALAAVLFWIIAAYLRIRRKETAGAFLVVDYAIVGSGVLCLSVIAITRLVVL